MSRSKTKWKKRAALGIIIIVALLLIAHILLGGGIACGLTRVRVKVRVNDASSGKPIPGVIVSLVRAETLIEQKSTNEKGQVVLSGWFGMGRSFHLLYATQSIGTYDHSIRCEKKGYSVLEAPFPKSSYKRFCRILFFRKPVPIIRLSLKLQKT